VAQAAITDRQAVLAQFVHHRAHDAGAGEDDFFALRLQPDDRASPGGIL
jgi:hypothetical protein